MPFILYQKVQLKSMQIFTININTCFRLYVWIYVQVPNRTKKWFHVITVLYKCSLIFGNGTLVNHKYNLFVPMFNISLSKDQCVTGYVCGYGALNWYIKVLKHQESIPSEKNVLQRPRHTINSRLIVKTKTFCDKWIKNRHKIQYNWQL